MAEGVSGGGGGGVSGGAGWWWYVVVGARTAGQQGRGLGRGRRRMIGVVGAIGMGGMAGTMRVSLAGRLNYGVDSDRVE